MRHSFRNDKKKELHRQKVKEFVKKHYSKERLKELRVLCLPGRELIEMEQIWDPLGVRGSNVTAAEINNECADEIRHRNKDRTKKGLEPVEVYEGDVSNLIASSHRPWDGIFLDVYSNFSRKWSTVIGMIAKNRLIKPDGFFVFNTLGSREGPKRQRDYLDRMQSSRALAMAVTKKMREEMIAALADRFSEYKEKRERLSDEFDLNNARDTVLTAHIAETFFYLPVISSDTFHTPFMEQKTSELIELYGRIDKLSGGEYLETISENGKKRRNAHDFIPHVAITLFQMLRMLFEKAELGDYFSATSLKVFRPYILGEVERYRYISKTKSVMISDLCKFRAIDRHLMWSPYPILLPTNGGNNGLMIKMGESEDEIAKTKHLLEKYEKIAVSAFEKIHFISREVPQRDTI